MDQLDYEVEKFFHASQLLQKSSEPLDRLAGEFSEIAPYSNTSLKSSLGRRTLESVTIWQNFDRATRTEQIVSRELQVGSSLKDMSFEIGMMGLYNQAFVQLRLVRQRGKTQLLMPGDDREYHNPIPSSSDPFKASRHFIQEIKNNHLRLS